MCSDSGIADETGLFAILAGFGFGIASSQASIPSSITIAAIRLGHDALALGAQTVQAVPDVTVSVVVFPSSSPCLHQECRLRIHRRRLGHSRRQGRALTRVGGGGVVVRWHPRHVGVIGALGSVAVTSVGSLGSAESGFSAAEQPEINTKINAHVSARH